jgi:phenylpropionate dioxygenase-like ring-hydroxylating dioxygenase large terminal subunit
MPAGSDPAWGRNSGDTLDVECHYLYVTDNLLDPSHVAWVHQSSIADTASANVPVDIHANANGSGLAVTRWTRAVEVPPFYSQFTKFRPLRSAATLRGALPLPRHNSGSVRPERRWRTGGAIPPGGVRHELI